MLQWGEAKPAGVPERTRGATQRQAALAGQVTPELEYLAAPEGVGARVVLRRPDLGLEACLKVMEKQARQGVAYMTVHAGVLRSHVRLTRERVTGIVSRGGAILAAWMAHHQRENFLFEGFDQVTEVLREHDVTY